MTAHTCLLGPRLCGDKAGRELRVSPVPLACCWPSPPEHVVPTVWTEVLGSLVTETVLCFGGSRVASWSPSPGALLPASTTLAPSLHVAPENQAASGSGDAAFQLVVEAEGPGGCPPAPLHGPGHVSGSYHRHHPFVSVNFHNNPEM